MTAVIIILAVTLVALAAFFAESRRELGSFVITDYSISSEKLDGLPGELKIVFLSDLHNKIYGSNNDVLLEAIRGQKPDLILITGDMLIGKAGVSYEPALEFVKRLPEIAKVYYANGNHEQRMKEHPEIYGDAYACYKRELVKHQVHFLENESAELHFGESRIRLNGIEVPCACYEKFAKTADIAEEIEQLLGRRKEGCYEILLAHNPAPAGSYRKWGADLVLSGHLHGGIIRLPFLGGLITPQAHIFPRMSGEMTEKDGSVFVVSKGLGTHTVNIRFCNPAEVVVLRLCPEAE